MASPRFLKLDLAGDSTAERGAEAEKDEAEGAKKQETADTKKQEAEDDAADKKDEAEDDAADKNEESEGDAALADLKPTRPRLAQGVDDIDDLRAEEESGELQSCPASLLQLTAHTPASLLQLTVEAHALYPGFKVINYNGSPMCIYEDDEQYREFQPWNSKEPAVRKWLHYEQEWLDNQAWLLKEGRIEVPNDSIRYLPDEEIYQNKRWKEQELEELEQNKKVPLEEYEKTKAEIEAMDAELTKRKEIDADGRVRTKFTRGRHGLVGNKKDLVGEGDLFPESGPGGREEINEDIWRQLKQTREDLMAERKERLEIYWEQYKKDPLKYPLEEYEEKKAKIEALEAELTKSKETDEELKTAADGIGNKKDLVGENDLFPDSGPGGREEINDEHNWRQLKQTREDLMAERRRHWFRSYFPDLEPREWKRSFFDEMDALQAEKDKHLEEAAARKEKQLEEAAARKEKALWAGAALTGGGLAGAGTAYGMKHG